MKLGYVEYQFASTFTMGFWLDAFNLQFWLDSQPIYSTNFRLEDDGIIFG
jgi:hypothetical protein